VPAAAAGLAALAVAIAVQRTGRELEPDPAPVRSAVRAAEPRLVLTNSAVAAFYLRGLPVVLDRPFGLGGGDEPPTERPYVVVDDERVGEGARPGPGRATRYEDYVVRVVGR
jgi:hypothetical protein